MNVVAHHAWFVYDVITCTGLLRHRCHHSFCCPCCSPVLAFVVVAVYASSVICMGRACMLARFDGGLEIHSVVTVVA